MITRKRSSRIRRKGNIVVLSAVLMLAMLAMLAFAIDMGYLWTVRTELQRSADSAALAAGWELISADSLESGVSTPDYAENAAETARNFAGYNSSGAISPDLGNDDVTVGYRANPFDTTAPLIVGGTEEPNTVVINVRRTSGQNGEVPLFFARVLGIETKAAAATATAALSKNIRGFGAPSNGDNLGILPFALDKETWDAMLAGGGSDNYTWDPETKTISNGPDGVKEVNLFPQGTGSPGNRGTIDIGSNNNSTQDIKRQILDGLSEGDLEVFGRPLTLDDDGEIEFNGDTGISAAIKDQLSQIMGEPRIIPIFSVVEGNGNNANYTCVAFVGVRIMYVKLTGSMNSKKVVIQPANVVQRGALTSTLETQTSRYVYSPVVLVQ